MLADNEGTVRDVAVGNAIVEHIDYDAFGNVLGEYGPSGLSLGSAALPRFTYTGQAWDAAAGMYYYRARWYDAGTGVFASQDPLGFGAGDANLSRYCFNSPTNGTDPSGMLFGWLSGLFDSAIESTDATPTDAYAMKNNPISLANELSRDLGVGPIYGNYSVGGQWHEVGNNGGGSPGGQSVSGQEGNGSSGGVGIVDGCSGGGSGTPTWAYGLPPGEPTGGQTLAAVLDGVFDAALAIVPLANSAANEFAAAGSGLVDGGGTAAAAASAPRATATRTNLQWHHIWPRRFGYPPECFWNLFPGRGQVRLPTGVGAIHTDITNMWEQLLPWRLGPYTEAQVKAALVNILEQFPLDGFPYR
jgi:RHS repeat-associated protein